MSGGKDSTAAALVAKRIYGELGIPIQAHHQIVEEDWAGTIEHCQRVCDMLDIPLVCEQAHYWGYACRYAGCQHRWLSTKPKIKCPKCKREDAGEVITEVDNLRGLILWRKRWPDYGRNRYCTAYLKREVFDKFARRNRDTWGDFPIAVMGERWLESTNRSKIPYLEERRGVSAMWDWHPILYLRRIDAFRMVRDNGLPLHECYHLQGMTDHEMFEVDAEGRGRMSCVCCIFKKAEAVAYNLQLDGQVHNHQIASDLVAIEAQTGHYFQEGLSIEAILEAILAGQRKPLTVVRHRKTRSVVSQDTGSIQLTMF
jgi:3'-phosphoadenosine 5'-phosphosulfate sulfotransferase (PAPS reductase)/FAD synthetase